MINFNLIDVDFLTTLLSSAITPLLIGMALIIFIELTVYGVIKAFNLLKL